MNRQEEVNRVLDALRTDALPGDDSIVEMAVATFHGRRRWLTAVTWAMSFMWFAVAVWCAVRFFDASETRPQIAWATGFLFSMMAVTALKIWAWMDMIHTSTMRQLRRVEAAVVRLAEGG